MDSSKQSAILRLLSGSNVLPSLNSSNNTRPTSSPSSVASTNTTSTTTGGAPRSLLLGQDDGHGQGPTSLSLLTSQIGAFLQHANSSGAPQARPMDIEIDEEEIEENEEDMDDDDEDDANQEQEEPQNKKKQKPLIREVNGDDDGTSSTSSSSIDIITFSSSSSDDGDDNSGERQQRQEEVNPIDNIQEIRMNIVAGVLEANPDNISDSNSDGNIIIPTPAALAREQKKKRRQKARMQKLVQALVKR